MQNQDKVQSHQKLPLSRADTGSTFGTRVRTEQNLSSLDPSMQESEKLQNTNKQSVFSKWRKLKHGTQKPPEPGSDQNQRSRVDPEPRLLVKVQKKFSCEEFRCPLGMLSEATPQLAVSKLAS